MHQRSMLALVTLALVALALLAAACSTTRPPSPVTLTCTPTVADGAVAVGSMVPVLGVPPGTTTLLASVGDKELWVAEFDDGDVALLAPFADSDDPYRSGSVRVSVTADGQPCADLTLWVEGLPHPDEPGVRGRFAAAVAELVHALDDLHDERSGVDAELEGLIAFLEYLVRSDDNPNAFTHVLERGTMTLDDEIVDVDIDLLDALLAHGAAAASPAAGAPAGTGPAPAGAPGEAPASALLSMRDVADLAATPDGLAELLRRQDEAEHVRSPALALSTTFVLASGAIASLWFPVVGTAASYAAVAISLGQVVLVEREVAYLPNDLSMTFEIDSPGLNEDGEGRWSDLQLHPSNKGSMDLVRAGVGAVLTVFGPKFDPSQRIPRLIYSMLTAAADSALQRVGIDSITVGQRDWAPVPIPVEDAGRWTVPYAEGVIVHHPTPPTYEATTTGPGQVGLRLISSRFLHRDYHATQDVYVEPIQVTVTPETAALMPGESIDFEVDVAFADDERVVWATSDGIIRVELTTFTWTAPDPAALAAACEISDHAPFEIRAESLSLTGARQPKYAPPLRYGVATVRVECSDFNGTWLGRWRSRVPWVGGDLYVELEQIGDALTGTVDVSGSNCLTRGVVSGTVSDGVATFGAVQGEHTITFTASLTGASGMSGTYAATTGECEGDTGSFSLERLP